MQSVIYRSHEYNTTPSHPSLVPGFPLALAKIKNSLLGRGESLATHTYFLGIIPLQRVFLFFWLKKYPLLVLKTLQ